jgi:hypothetical protein
METTNADEKNLRFAIYYSRSQQKKYIYICQMLIFIQILRLKYSSLMSKIIIYLNRKEKKRLESIYWTSMRWRQFKLNDKFFLAQEN